nr:hypothetical protein [Actinomyces sp. HMSC065F12]
MSAPTITCTQAGETLRTSKAPGIEPTTMIGPSSTHRFQSMSRHTVSAMMLALMTARIFIMTMPSTPPIRSDNTGPATRPQPHAGNALQTRSQQDRACNTTRY